MGLRLVCVHQYYIELGAGVSVGDGSGVGVDESNGLGVGLASSVGVGDGLDAKLASDDGRGRGVGLKPLCGSPDPPSGGFRGLDSGVALGLGKGDVTGTEEPHSPCSLTIAPFFILMQYGCLVMSS